MYKYVVEFDDDTRSGDMELLEAFLTDNDMKFFVVRIEKRPLSGNDRIVAS